jgi:heme-degrading monooxygenase HmoA
MVVVFVRFPINPQYKEEFKKYAVEKFGEHGINTLDGFISMRVLEPKQLSPNMPENNTFVIETIWRDMEAFKNYTQSDIFRKAHEKQPPKEFFAGQPTVEVYEVIKEVQ